MSGRIRFANQLRGLAALSVALSHLVGVYWIMPGVVSATTFSPPQAGPPPGILPLVAYPWVNFGPLGVAVFFLISGFVIPFSLEKHGRVSFAAARLLRIYPTYIAVLLLETLALALAARLWHIPFAYGPRTLISNALLVYDVIGEPSIDLVNWTLSVELKFYALAILLLPAFRRGKPMPLLLAALVILAVNAAMSRGLLGDIAAPPSSVSYTVSSHSVCLTYMMIGTAFNFHLRRLISTLAATALVAALGTLFVLTWRTGVWADQYPVVTLNYAYAFLVFAPLYALRRFVPPNKPLDAMAAISFPFYALHSLVGYTLLRALMVGAGFTYTTAIAITLPTLLALAALVHRAVERPTAEAGRRLATAWTARELASP